MQSANLNVTNRVVVYAHAIALHTSGAPCDSTSLPLPLHTKSNFDSPNPAPQAPMALAFRYPPNAPRNNAAPVILAEFNTSSDSLQMKIGFKEFN